MWLPGIVKRTLREQAARIREVEEQLASRNREIAAWERSWGEVQGKLAAWDEFATKARATYEGVVLDLVAWRNTAIEAAYHADRLEKGYAMRWKAQERAIDRWRAEDPDRFLARPDHADLCVWLIEKLEEMGALPARVEVSWTAPPGWKPREGGSEWVEVPPEDGDREKFLTAHFGP